MKRYHGEHSGPQWGRAVPIIRESTTGGAMPTTLTPSHQSGDAAGAVRELRPSRTGELEFELAAIDTAYEMPSAYADGETFTVFTKSEGEQSFTSALTDSQCEQCLRYTSGRSKFAYDMRQAHLRGRISPKQRAWLHKLANEWLVKMTR